MSTDAEILQRRLERERAARKQAEAILEAKAKELYELNQSLELQIQQRTAQLEESERSYRNIVDNADDIIYNISAEGIFTYVNPAALAITEFTAEEAIGSRFQNIIRDDFKEKVIIFYAEMVRNKKEKTYYEFPIVSKSGRDIWIGQKTNLVEDKDGSFSFTVMARDITKRKIAEAELIIAKNEIEKSEYKYRSIMENMMLGLLEVDLEGRVTKAYPRFCEMVGYQEKEIIGKIAEDILMPDMESKEAIKEKNKERLDKKSDVYETVVKRKNGELVNVLISAAPFYDSFGKVIGSIGIHYDITERNRLKVELEKAKSLAEKAQQAEAHFLASMSHEIRTPLNAIVGMSHLLQDAKLNSDEKEYLEILKSSSNVLQKLISDVLDISKIDAGKLEIHNKPFDLEKLVLNLKRTFQVKLDSKPVSVISHQNFELDHLVLGDELLLNQILLNLIGNAEKFTEKGFITIDLELLERKKESLSIKFLVKDTGVGIARDQLSKIFEQFKQAHAEIRKDYGGTGLGLAITKKLIDLLGSEIFVESEIGKGTSFSFILDFGTTDIKTNEIEKYYSEELKFAEIDGRVLIVEDNPMNQKYITRLLEKWGLQYHVSNNGEEAVEICQREKFAIIFMDLQMPIMNGYEATNEIREKENLNQETPIVALTASTLLSKKQMALDAGMSDFLSKPFNPKQLSETLLNQFKLEAKEEVKSDSSNQFAFNPKLDVDYLIEQYGDDLQYGMEMMEVFLESVQLEFEVMKTSVSIDDFKTFAKSAHKIKPTFTMVGLSQFSTLFAQIEKEAKANKAEAFDLFGSVSKELKPYFQLIQSEIDKLHSHLKI